MLPIYYFAYGSNVDVDRMRDRGVDFQNVQPARLEGYMLRFDKQSSKKPNIGFANIVPYEGGVVEGALYNLSSEDIQKLDKFEGAPKHYRRQEVTVILTSGEKVSAIAYVAQPEMVREGLLPSREYLDHILNGRRFFTEVYYQKLLSTPVATEGRPSDKER